MHVVAVWQLLSAMNIKLMFRLPCGLVQELGPMHALLYNGLTVMQQGSDDYREANIQVNNTLNMYFELT